MIIYSRSLLSLMLRPDEIYFFLSLLESVLTKDVVVVSQHEVDCLFSWISSLVIIISPFQSDFLNLLRDWCFSWIWMSRVFINAFYVLVSFDIYVSILSIRDLTDRDEVSLLLRRLKGFHRNIWICFPWRWLWSIFEALRSWFLFIRWDSKVKMSQYTLSLERVSTAKVHN